MNIFQHNRHVTPPVTNIRKSEHAAKITTLQILALHKLLNKMHHIYPNTRPHTLLPTRLLILMHVERTIPYYSCTYDRLPEDEPSGSKHVEASQIEILVQKRCILLVYIL